MTEQSGQADDGENVISMHEWQRAKKRKQDQVESSAALHDSETTLSGETWEGFAHGFDAIWPLASKSLREFCGGERLDAAIATVSRYDPYLVHQYQCGMLDETMSESLYKEYLEEKSLDDLINQLLELTPQMARDNDIQLDALSRAFKDEYFIALGQYREENDEE